MYKTPSVGIIRIRLKGIISAVRHPCFYVVIIIALKFFVVNKIFAVFYLHIEVI